MVSPLVVVEAQVALERGFELPEPREVATTKFDAPVLVKDRLLEPLDEAVGEGVSRFRAGVADAEITAGLVEDALELASRRSGKSALRKYGTTRFRRKSAATRARGAPTKTWARAKEEAASQAVICQTGPTPLSFPM